MTRAVHTDETRLIIHDTQDHAGRSMPVVVMPVVVMPVVDALAQLREAEQRRTEAALRVDALMVEMGCVQWMGP